MAYTACAYVQGQPETERAVKTLLMIPSPQGRDEAVPQATAGSAGPHCPKPSSRHQYDPRAHYANALITVMQNKVSAGEECDALMDKIESVLWPTIHEGRGAR